MGRAGRPRKPTQLKILQGNPGRRPLNSNEPMPEPVAPPCPPWLDDEARAKWDMLAPHLEGLGLLTIVDGDVLAAYCQAWAEFRWATETLRKEGRTIRIGGTPRSSVEDADGARTTTEWTGGQFQPHPAVAQQRSAWKAIKEFAALFGLDPSSRSRLSVPGGEPDELETFLDGDANAS